MKNYFSLFSILFLSLHSLAQISHPLLSNDLIAQMQWVDEKYNAMTLEEKVGQLFIVAAYSNRDETHYSAIENLVKEEAIGGLIFMQDQADKQIELINRYNSVSKIPLIIGMDAEWGASMRIREVERFPWAMTVGAVSNNDLVEQMGENIGEQVSRIGVHFNFAPTVDVNTNPENPVIGSRSYGSNVENVAQKGIAYMRGMMKHKVLSSAKHFPGHGDTSTDSHKILPLVNHEIERLKAVELATFQKLIDAGVASVMIAHLNVPALDDSGTPSSLSKKIVTDLLKKEMNFKGLVITDALNMAGVSNQYAPGTVDLMAFEAGNDILLFSQDVKTAKSKIIEKIQSGEIDESRLEESVKKILMAKYLVGLNQPKILDSKNVMKDLNKVQYAQTSYQLYKEAATLLENKNNLLPIKDLSDLKIAYVPLEEGDFQYFHECLNFHLPIDLIEIKSVNQISRLNEYDIVIVGLHKSNETVYKSYRISNSSQQILKSIAAQNQTILSLFASPYALKNLDLEDVNSVLVFYQNLKDTHAIAANVIFGVSEIQGFLPVDVNEKFKFGTSIKTQSLKRLGTAHPEAVGMDSEIINQIDDMAMQAIHSGATPGMQIVAAKNGQVIYNKAFGHHTYEKTTQVEKDDLYDLASVTKILGSLPLLIQEVDRGELSLDQKLASILPETARTDKGELTLREVLAHQSGLPPWIGFYKESVNVQNARLYLDYYSRKQDEEHPIKVTDNIYIIGSIRDTIMTDVLYAPLSNKSYKYSDLGYYLFQDYLEKKYENSLDILVSNEFFKPMNLKTTTYTPRDKFPLEKIVPTSKDKIYRNQLLHGFVQDEGAAMMGGVAAHAGLFSSAQDIARLMQMYLNGGEYGGIQFFKPESLSQFTQKQFNNNHRGAGFDKPRNNSNNGPSVNSYGHYGFTGTMAWNDPDHELIYVILTNRIHPDVDNRKLQTQKVRENIQLKLYEAIVN